MKTKPTQQSVGKLREIGIQPDILICRTEKPMTEEMFAKISLFCNVVRDAVIEERDVDFSIYEVPIRYHEEGFDDRLLEILGIHDAVPPDLSRWQDIADRLAATEGSVKIAIVGKYTDLLDAYKSLAEALTPGGTPNDRAVHLGSPGHTVEFLGLALDSLVQSERLGEPWITPGVVHLCELFQRTRSIDLECGALYHAAHGLALYRDRRFGHREVEVLPAALAEAAGEQ